MLYNSVIITFTFMILFRIKDCRNTHTRRTNRDCINLSLTFSHDEMQLEIYKWRNSVGKLTDVVSLRTTKLFNTYLSLK